MNEPATMHTGPLGSTVHVLHADAELAAVDWNRMFHRGCLDPVRGLVTPMAPSHLHEDPTTLRKCLKDWRRTTYAKRW